LARDKLKTLTEQMFYTMLCFNKQCCGVDVMRRAREITKGRVCIGPGTLYNLIEQFLHAGLICETGVEGRRISYILTEKGKKTLEEEYNRLIKQIDDYNSLISTGSGGQNERF
jgi:DNA-binding PadR family transcriptional regulator